MNALDRIGRSGALVDDCARLFDAATDRLDPESVSALGPVRARRVLSMFEILMASAQRHAGDQPHMTLFFRSDRASAVLDRLATLAAHPPRGSHHSLWLDDWAEGQIRYTPMQAESVFAELVRDTDKALMPICDFGFDMVSGALDGNDPATAVRLNALVAEVHAVRKRYARLGGESRVSGWFLHFRQFLGPLDLCGRRVLGPNPAFLASWPAVDILFGLADADYLADTRDRYDGYLAEDIALIERAVAAPKVPDVMRAAPTPFVESFRHAARAMQALSGRHWAAIEDHLIAPSADHAADAVPRTTLSPEAGVSGRGLDKTWALLASRRGDNPARRAIRHWSMDIGKGPRDG